MSIVSRVLAFVNFIASNPGFAAWLIGGLISIIAALIGIYYGLIFQRVSKLEIRVNNIENTLEEYERHTQRVDSGLASLTIRIDKHMADEESKVWVGVDTITAKVSAIQNTHGERLARIESTLESLHKNLPSEEIVEVLELLRKMANKA